MILIQVKLKTNQNPGGSFRIYQLINTANPFLFEWNWAKIDCADSLVDPKRPQWFWFFHFSWVKTISFGKFQSLTFEYQILYNEYSSIFNHSSQVIYPKYSKHWLSTLAHTIYCVCSKISNHGLLFSLFKFLGEKTNWNNLKIRIKIQIPILFNILVLLDVQANLPEANTFFVCPKGFVEHLFSNVYSKVKLF